jgi:hypothetical protein
MIHNLRCVKDQQVHDLNTSEGAEPVSSLSVHLRIQEQYQYLNQLK